MWISSEKKCVEKSLPTKKKADAVDLAEELYIQLRNELANGKTLFTNLCRSNATVHCLQTERSRCKCAN